MFGDCSLHSLPHASDKNKEIGTESFVCTVSRGWPSEDRKVRKHSFDRGIPPFHPSSECHGWLHNIMYNSYWYYVNDEPDETRGNSFDSFSLHNCRSHIDRSTLVASRIICFHDLRPGSLRMKIVSFNHGFLKQWEIYIYKYYTGCSLCHYTQDFFLIITEWCNGISTN